MLSHMLRAATPKSPARSISYVTTVQNTSNATTYTFSGVSLGTTDATRLVVIGVVGSGATSRTISGVTVGGVSATLVEVRDGASTNNAIYQIANSSDSTANIVVTFSGGEERAAINVWALYNLNSNTKEDSNDAFSTNNSVSTTITGTAGGVAVAQGTINTTAGTATWTNLTENNEVTLESTIEYSAATSSNAAASLTATVNWGNSTNKTIIAARWA